MAADGPREGAKPRMNETSWAILGSVVISIVLATLMVGNPFHSLRMAYFDYSQSVATKAPK